MAIKVIRGAAEKESAAKAAAKPSAKTAAGSKKRPSGYGTVKPPAGTPFIETADLDLDMPVKEALSLLLKANVPTVVTLTGSPDLLFSAFTVGLTARPLQRDVALADWGTSASDLDSGQKEYLLAGLTRVESVGAEASSGTSTEITYRENGQYPDSPQVKVTLAASGKKRVGYRNIAFQTDAVQAEDDVTIHLYSPSLPARVGISVGDDSPLQVFPAAMAENGSVTSRDLAGQVNAAWARATAGADKRKHVIMKLTSQTDGMVDLKLEGPWGHSSVQPDAPLAVVLDPVNPVTLQVPWPFGAMGGTATLQLTGRLTGGKRLHLAEAACDFQVRVQEHVEVAQAVQIAPGGATGEARQVTAVWLLLPAVPQAEEKLELRLAAAAGDPAGPADQPLARAEVALPADAAAYVAEGGRFWYRAVFEKPLDLDGSQVGQPLYVVAAGRGAGSLLCHKLTGPMPGAGRVPAGPGKAGAALVRNLGRTGAWELQPYSQKSAAWAMDLELAPLAAEYGALVKASVPGKPEQAAAFTGPGQESVALTWPDLPGGTDLAITLRSAVGAQLQAQVMMYKLVK
jgi:hypothetical protein